MFISSYYIFDRNNVHLMSTIDLSQYMFSTLWLVTKRYILFAICNCSYGNGTFAPYRVLLIKSPLVNNNIIPFLSHITNDLLFKHLQFTLRIWLQWKILSRLFTSQTAFLQCFNRIKTFINIYPLRVCL